MRLIWGREDRILPPKYAEWLHARIPTAELHWVEGAGHLLQDDAPGQLSAYLTAGFPSDEGRVAGWLVTSLRAWSGTGRLLPGGLCTPDCLEP